MQYYVLIADLYVHILLTYRQIPRLRAPHFLDACILRLLVFMLYIFLKDYVYSNAIDYAGDKGLLDIFVIQ